MSEAGKARDLDPAMPDPARMVKRAINHLMRLGYSRTLAARMLVDVIARVRVDMALVGLGDTRWMIDLDKEARRISYEASQGLTWKDDAGGSEEEG